MPVNWDETVFFSIYTVGAVSVTNAKSITNDHFVTFIIYMKKLSFFTFLSEISKIFFTKEKNK